MPSLTDVKPKDILTKQAYSLYKRVGKLEVAKRDMSHCPCFVRVGGASLLFADNVCCPAYPYFFPLFITMCNYNYAPGAVHLDIHHNNISTMPSMIRELVHSFASNAAPNDVAEVVPDTDEIPDEELFKYIHPSITAEDEKRQIHLEVRNLVQHLPLPEICKYLRQMYKQKRVYLNVKSESMFDELHRMGMPDESNQGFSQKNFQNYFNIND